MPTMSTAGIKSSLALAVNDAAQLSAPAHSLTVVVVVFGAALVAAWFMRAIRAPTILGFLVVGMALGPFGVGLIGPEQGRDQVQFFADLGLVMLLFTVGLELAPEPALRMGGRLLLAAALQLGLTTLAAAAAMRFLLDFSWLAAWTGGLAVSVSSTAIILKHLSDRDQTDSPAGGLITGVSLLQDILVIVALVPLPLLALAAPVQAHWSLQLGKIGLAIGVLIVVSILARRAMPALVSLVFRFGGQELMTLFAIVMACVGAWLASLADWSWPLGSFIAGLLLAQTDVRHQLRAEIAPFREASNALFFVAIGMLADLRIFAQHGVALSVAIGATVVLKTILGSAAVLLAGWPLRLAVTAGLGLCTISEFGYVLMKEAGRLQIISPDFLPVFITWAVGTMVLGAVLVPTAAPLSAIAVRRFDHAAAARAPLAGRRVQPGRPFASHVIVVGYGINGRNLARVLNATRIPFVVIEFNRANARTAREDGSPVIVGDAARMEILTRGGLSTARAVVVSIADRDATRRIVAQVHRAQPDVYILARTRYVAEIETLHRLGARQVIPEEFETSIEIFAHVLREFAVPDNVIDQQITLVRAGHYGMLRGRPTDRDLRAEWLQVLEAAVTQTYLLATDSAACGRTIRDIELRARTGVTIVAVTRHGQPIANPQPDFQLMAGDVLVLVGAHRQLDDARALLDPPTQTA